VSKLATTPLLFIWETSELIVVEALNSIFFPLIVIDALSPSFNIPRLPRVELDFTPLS